MSKLSLLLWDLFVARVAAGRHGGDPWSIALSTWVTGHWHQSASVATRIYPVSSLQLMGKDAGFDKSEVMWLLKSDGDIERGFYIPERRLNFVKTRYGGKSLRCEIARVSWFLVKLWSENEAIRCCKFTTRFAIVESLQQPPDTLAAATGRLPGGLMPDILGR